MARLFPLLFLPPLDHNQTLVLTFLQRVIHSDHRFYISASIYLF